MERHLDLTFVIIWSLAVANVLGTVSCLLLARPISRLTLVPFARLAPFMLVIVFFAAYQTTRSWGDLIALFLLGALGVFMKRFGWSPPALLIGFVLANRLDASVYQSIQVYGASFLERGGVQFMLLLIAVSVLIGARMKPHRTALTADGPHAPVNRGPQSVFLALVAAYVLWVLYDLRELAFLGKVFPMAVAIITLGLLAALAVVVARNRPSYAIYDAERESTGGERPVASETRVLSWILALLAVSALVGFVLGSVIYITLFLRLKAAVRWPWAIVGGLAAMAVLAALGHFLVLHYPEGLLQHYFELPWPLD